MPGSGLSSDFCNMDPGEGPSRVTPVARESSFTSSVFSPFKDHLKISDRAIFTRTRKVVRTKSKIPLAVSGKDLSSYLQNQQDEKRRAIEDFRRKIGNARDKQRKSEKIKTKEERGQKMLLQTLTEHTDLWNEHRWCSCSLCTMMILMFPLPMTVKCAKLVWGRKDGKKAMHG